MYLQTHQAVSAHAVPEWHMHVLHSQGKTLLAVDQCVALAIR